MVKEIDISEVEPTKEDKLQMAIEESCAKLVEISRKQGLLLSIIPNVGLMYLPDQSVTQQFKDACKAVIDCLAAQVPKDDSGENG